MTQGQPIETAPKDRDVLVWYDHDKDPYQDPSGLNMLTPYATLAEGIDCLYGSGFAIARWHPQFWESEDIYGSGYWMPAAWFALESDEYARVCNPILWWELPPTPEKE